MPDPTTCDASTLAAAERECDEDGSPCAGTIVVSRTAALCIASEEAGLTTLEGPYVELTYHYGFKRPIWNVFTVNSVTDDGARSGGSYAIDAASGELLGSSGWSETP
jgi:hypothetical protein